MIGMITNLETEGLLITFQTQNVWCLQRYPFKFARYSEGTYFTLSERYHGVLHQRIICGFFKAA